MLILAWLKAVLGVSQMPPILSSAHELAERLEVRGGSVSTLVARVEVRHAREVHKDLMFNENEVNRPLGPTFRRGGDLCPKHLTDVPRNAMAPLGAFALLAEQQDTQSADGREGGR